ncbi:MAG: 3'-5' exonuclease [Gammaproteobacteria bacterium]|nr:3'-5' exonuclease [Gammaproteobacteria bacterium]
MAVEPTLAFDIETVPDVDGARRLYPLDGVDAAAAEAALLARQRAEKGNEFLPPHLQRVAAIACCLRAGDELRVWSLGDPAAAEAELIQRFFDGIEKYRPVLVSWNGSGFDLPVMHYRALIHGIAAPRYWDTGHFERESKWDSYIGRYQFRHIDLMDVLALYQARNYVRLDELARLCGLPGKLGMDGSQVADAVRAGRLAAVRAYCETDALNTYLLFLRFQRLRGLLDADAWLAEEARVRAFVAAGGAPHWVEFARAWGEGPCFATTGRDGPERPARDGRAGPSENR